MTEEQCREVVKTHWTSVGDIFYNYESTWFEPIITAKEAFASLMQANGINEPHLILKRL